MQIGMQVHIAQAAHHRRKQFQRAVKIVGVARTRCGLRANVILQTEKHRAMQTGLRRLRVFLRRGPARLFREFDLMLRFFSPAEVAFASTVLPISLLQLMMPNIRFTAAG
jgi:hypothetical protein